MIKTIKRPLINELSRISLDNETKSNKQFILMFILLSQMVNRLKLTVKEKSFSQYYFQVSKAIIKYLYLNLKLIIIIV